MSSMSGVMLLATYATRDNLGAVTLDLFPNSLGWFHFWSISCLRLHRPKRKSKLISSLTGNTDKRELDDTIHEMFYNLHLE